MSHTIRLRDHWGISEAGGRSIHSRNFGKPRIIDPTERVWLICSALPASAEVTLNGELIGSIATSGPFSADVTFHLQGRNTLSFTVPLGKRPGEVAIEIRGQSN
jgi:hypothetical protein